MKRNNLLSLLCHILLCVLGLLVSILVSIPFFQKQSLFFLALWLIFFIMCGLYVIAGRFMKEQENAVRSLLSVSSVSILLLLVAVVCTLLSLHPTQDPVWAAYIIANLSLFSVVIGEIGNGAFIALAFLFAPIPSLCLWLGMNAKKPWARP
jgi:hypothetical protein